MEIVYCANGNKRFAQIAIDAGMRYGAQMPNTIHHPIWFADQDWRKPNRQRYMAALAEHRPHLATVLDWEHPEQLSQVLSWAEEAAAYVDQVAIIPKVIGGVARIPDTIGGKPVILAYSVPTRYAGTQVPLWEFGRRPTHLLGGSPHAQIELTHYLNVVSIDGNYTKKMAIYCQFWTPGDATYAKDRYWPRLTEADGHKWEHDAPYEAFRRSCHNIMDYWRKHPCLPKPMTSTFTTSTKNPTLTPT